MPQEWVGGQQFYFGEGASGSVHIDVSKWCVEGDFDKDEPFTVELEADNILAMAEIIRKERDHGADQSG